MINTPRLRPFQPHSPDVAGVISWAHIGDLHMTLSGEQNHLDLVRLVDELNRAFADSLAFAYTPGDVADQGAASQYQVVRQVLDTLQLPWCAIIGDHDVHEKSFANFRNFMASETRFSFSAGAVRFFALNAFDVPDPASFVLLSDQLAWLEKGLQAVERNQSAVLFLHCYPTDLKQGGQELRQLISRHPVTLVDMGHTHYNEMANDGRVIYTATRSTGQIEEGPAGFSITNIDGPVISWKFLPLGTLPAVMIISPADERFITDRLVHALTVIGDVRIRAKAWSTSPVQSVVAHLAGATLQLKQIPGSHVWEAQASKGLLEDGIRTLLVEATDQAGKQATDEIHMVVGVNVYKAPARATRDQDNALGAWPERGIFGTQLGPNKFGRKW